MRYNNISIKVDVDAGASIQYTCEEMCSLAKHTEQTLKTNFNYVTIKATPNTTPEHMVSKFHKDLHIYDKPM